MDFLIFNFVLLVIWYICCRLVILAGLPGLIGICLLTVLNCELCLQFCGFFFYKDKIDCPLCCSMGRFPLPTEKQRHQIVQHRKNYEMNLSASLRVQTTAQRGMSAPPKICKFLLPRIFLDIIWQSMFIKMHSKELIFVRVRNGTFVITVIST